MSSGANPNDPRSGDGCTGADGSRTCGGSGSGAPNDGGTSDAGVLCPPDFVLNAPCRILNVSGGTVQMSATELGGYSAGNYRWTTASGKIRLTNGNTSTVTVQPLANPSASRDAEVITVTRSSPGCPDITKTVNITVAKVTFSASASQRYGYDNFDTPANPLDDHVCMKTSDYTLLKVDIVGGALGTDFDFVCDDPSICAPVAPGGVASFDLHLNAGTQTKAETTLHAKVKCPSAESFTHIQVHVYQEKLVEVVVAKIYDSTQAGTSLRFPTADYAATTGRVNAKVNEAVVRYDISNYDPGNARTDVRFDLDANGVLSFDIAAADSGREFKAIADAMTGTGTKIRIAIVKDMKSYYYLASAAAVGDTTITVTAGSVFAYPAGSFPLGSGASQENVTVSSSAGSVITLGSALTKAHAAGEPLEFPAGGWSSDPIIIREGSMSLDLIKWTIPHEAGHRALLLADIDGDSTTIMYYSRSWTDYRLRYCPRTKRYGGGTENQWETIPR